MRIVSLTFMRPPKMVRWESMIEKLPTEHEQLTEQEETMLTALLKRLQPGFLPFPVFQEVARLVTTPIVEVVPLRIHDGRTEILLIPRLDDDPTWPGQLHVPGTTVRASDTPGSFDDAFDRIFKGEIASVTVRMSQFVLNVLHHSGRGMEASQVHWAEVEGEPEEGEFYDVDNLPDSLVVSQRDFIPAAIRDFKQFQNREK